MEEGRTKEEVLGELYAIRATMSLVSQNEDKAEPTRNELSNSDSSVNREERNRKESDEMYQRRTKELRDQREKTLKSSCPRVPHSSINPLLYTGYSFAVAWIPLAYGLISIMFNNGNRSMFLWMGVLPLCIGIAIPLFTFLISCYLRIRENEYLRVTWTEKFEREKANALCEINQEFVRITNDHNQKVAHANSVIKTAKERIPLCKKTLDEIGEKSRQIIDCAKETYKAIDYRDWENVDLLIFYFETGRADSLKESLQLVDRQRQTNEIVRAVYYASRQISSSIQNSVQKLGKALALSFDRLSDQMQRQHRELLESSEKQRRSLDDLNEGLRGIKGKIEEANSIQITSDQMQSALLSKIDQSSAQLAADMDKQLRFVHGRFY